MIGVLRGLFARFGLPETVVTDNGTGFVSQEFEEFLRKNGISHVTSAPYHPASNGLAERAVQIVKKGVKKETTGSMDTRLARMLFSYRITPQSTTGLSPSELLLGRRPRTRLDPTQPRGLRESRRHKRTDMIGNLVYEHFESATAFSLGISWLVDGGCLDRSQMC